VQRNINAAAHNRRQAHTDVAEVGDAASPGDAVAATIRCPRTGSAGRRQDRRRASADAVDVESVNANQVAARKGAMRREVAAPHRIAPS